MILDRHFDSKSDPYRAVLDHACLRLAAAFGEDEFTSASLDPLLDAAAADPDGFRLLFQHAAVSPSSGRGGSSRLLKSD